VRFGGAAYAPVGDKGLFFASGLLHYTEETGDGTITASGPGLPPFTSSFEGKEKYYGPDLTLGYVRRLGERIDLDVRYRATAYVAESDSDNPRVNHGMSLGFSFWFGD
jgi:hypothetical protein